MASTVRPFALRHGLLAFFKQPIRTQRRNAQAHDIRFVQTRTLPPIFEKYKEKLDAKMKAEGVNSVDELREAYKDAIEGLRKEAPIDLTPIPGITKELPQQSAPVPTPVTSTIAKAAQEASGKPPGIKTLASYVDVEKLNALPTAKEIEFIWRARFVADPQSICAVIPHEKYAQMEADAKKHPMFLLPLPREGQGVEMQFLQWSFPSQHSSTIIFTSLEEYRLRGEWATPHTTLTHHLELANEKKVVLTQGAVNKDCGVSADEARWLVIALQKFYGAKEDSEVGKRRKKMLEQFTSGDQNFKVESLISEVEMID